jgi:hypothetical protein
MQMSPSWMCQAQEGRSFLKKRTKKIMLSLAALKQKDKSFLFLFFKKEILAFLISNQNK